MHCHGMGGKLVDGSVAGGVALGVAMSKGGTDRWLL